MKITANNHTLRVSDVRAFNDPVVDELIRDLRTALKPDHVAIEFDLAHTREADCDTVDALLTVFEEFDRDGAVRAWRLVNPPPDLRQLLQLVRLHHVFEITPPHPSRMILA